MYVRVVRKTMGGEGETYLCISRIGVENIGEEFTRTSHARDDQSVNVKTVDDKEMGEIVIFTLRVQGRGDGRVGTRVLAGHAC